MDIRFHYYAINTLAQKAGFSGSDAQLLAEYSQFVDDYNMDGEICVENVPEFARHLAREEGSLWRFACVTTGFRDAGDYAQLPFRNRQRDILLPFHLIPPQSLKTKVEDSAAWRTQPETLKKPTLLRGLLEHAQTRYKAEPSRPHLIRLGLLLHIFADTYAHQKFCGYGGWWNYGAVVSADYHTVRDDDFDLPGGEFSAIARKNHAACGKESSEGRAFSQAVNGYDPVRNGFKAFYIAHAAFGWAPDDPTCFFRAVQQAKENSEDTFAYERKNREIFLDGAKVVFNFLRGCRNLGPVNESEWAPLKERVRDALLTSKTSSDTLDRRWKYYFPDIDYDYNMWRLFPRPKAPGAAVYAPEEDFFRYNAFAHAVRQAVKGES